MSLLRGCGPPDRRRPRSRTARYWCRCRGGRKRISRITVRGCTPSWVVIQSPSSSRLAPRVYTGTAPITSTSQRSAASRSGTVMPMWSVPRRPGMPGHMSCHVGYNNTSRNSGSRRQDRCGDNSIAIGFNPVGTRAAYAETSVVWTPVTPWVEISTTAGRLEGGRPRPARARCSAQLHLIRAFEETVLELAGESARPRPRALEHRAGGRRRRIHRRTAAPPDGVNGSHRGHHQFLAKALTHVTGGTAGSRRARSERGRSSTVLQPHPRRDPRPRRRATAAAAAVPCTCSGSRPARSAPTRSSAAGPRWRPATRGRRSTPRTDGDIDLTINYFGDGASQIGSILESMNLAATWKLPVCVLHREQPLRRVDARARRDLGRPPPVSIRGQGFGDPRLARRRHGPARRAPRAMEEAAEERMRAGDGPDRDRGRGVPLLPPERTVPGQRVRVPHEGGGGRPGARATRSSASRRR